LAVAHTAEQIANLLDKSRQGKAYFETGAGEKRPLGPGDIAVLVPRHIDATEVFEALAQRGIASVRQVQEKVLQSAAALTLLRLIKSVAEPANEAYILELLGDPLVGFTAQDIYNLKENAREWENLLEAFWALRETWIELGFSAMYRQWLSWEDKNSSLSERLIRFTEGERHLTDLMHLSEILQEQNRYVKGIQPLLTWLQHAIDGDSGDDESQLRLESDSKRVKLVTLHACKGLEYNLVFCPFLWAGKTPREDSIVAAHQDDQTIVDFGSDQFSEHVEIANEEVLMEQLRLLYVALTRGVHHCYVFWAHVQYGQYIYTANSALAWLLYGDSSMHDNVCEQLRDKVKNMSFDEIAQGVINFSESANLRQPEHISENRASVSYQIIKQIETGTSLDPIVGNSLELQSAKLPDGNLPLSWWQTSFSKLVDEQHASFTEQIDDSFSNEEGILAQQKLEEGSDYTIV